MSRGIEPPFDCSFMAPPLRCAALQEIIQEQLSGIDGDEVEAEPLPPNGMSSVWVLPEVFDLDIEVKVWLQSPYLLVYATFCRFY